VGRTIEYSENLNVSTNTPRSLSKILYLKKVNYHFQWVNVTIDYILKIVDADGELLEDEKNIVAFIFTSLK
jgi:hypothetical protein